MTLFWLSGAFLSGIGLGSITGPLPAAALAGAVLLIALAWFLRRTGWWLAALVLLAFVLGLCRAPAVPSPTPTDLSYYIGKTVELTGTIAAEPDIRDTGANYIVAVDGRLTGRISRPIHGLLAVHTTRAVQLEYNERVSIRGRLLAPGRYVPSRQVAARLQYPRILDLGPSSTGWLSWIIPLRQRIEAGINAWLPEPEAALLIAITLGARSASLGDLAHALTVTGLIHLVAISGIKVALVAGTIHELIRRVAHRLVTLAMSLAILWFYVLLTGLTPSGTRSAIMWSLVFTAVALGRRTVALVSLSAAAAVMVGLDPTLLADIGFLLSAVGTFAIIALAEPINRLLRPLPSPWREALGVTIAAQIGTLPIVIIGFHLIAGSGPLANMLVLPLLPLLILAGFLLGALSGVPLLASPLSAFTYMLLAAIIRISDTLAGWGGALPAAAISPPALVLYYALLGAAALLLLRRAHWAPAGSWGSRTREFAVTALIGTSLLTADVLHAAAPPAASLIWVGTGDAILLRSAGSTALIGGSPHPFQLLSRLGAQLPFDQRTIDLVVVTDPRAGPVAGLDALFSHYQIGEVLDVGAEYPSSTYARWRRDVRDRRIPAYALRTGVRVRFGQADIIALGPDAVYPDPRDSAALLRVAVPGRSCLLAGAASAREQRETVFRPVHLRSSILITDRSPQTDFVRTVAPRVILRTDRLSQQAPVDLNSGR